MLTGLGPTYPPAPTDFLYKPKKNTFFTHYFMIYLYIVERKKVGKVGKVGKPIDNATVFADLPCSMR